ncbi:MAG: response regulator [Burkholderiaceae bacterium]|jgi:DNA-binding response OmpR family regulator|nr:response regulator [Burkholderiaceae bacterium]MDH5207773.1 response regulator [Burkholderiaceae bacterium]
METANPTLMVVDDDRLVLATLVAGLRQAGFDVIEADNGDDAILLARKHKPRLAILDMRMQGKSGMDVARYLAANTDTGFMFLSAFGDSDIVEEATRMGALGYLVKPLDVRQIVPAVRAALSRATEMRSSPPSGSAPVPDAQGRDDWIAIGILMERLRLDYDRALLALRAQAQAENKDVGELAASMVEAANRLNSIRR